MKNIYLAVLLTALAFSGCAQSNPQKKEQKANEKKIGGGCEGCEAIYESKVPFDQLTAVDTLPDFFEEGPKLKISGTIYKSDGKTPAPGVVLYIYHTDQQGNYSTRGTETGWGKRHGSLRGWIKTDEKGSYTFYTLRPASYPNSRNPQHIHPVIKEPGYSEYWIDEFLFSDDPYLEKGQPGHKARGSNGVLDLIFSDGMLQAKRDIVLGLNVPGY